MPIAARTIPAAIAGLFLTAAAAVARDPAPSPHRPPRGSLARQRLLKQRLQRITPGSLAEALRHSRPAWERLTPDKGYESGEHDYRTEDDHAQARLTEACFDWLEDEAKPHPTRLERSLAQFNAILGIYTSALRHEPVALPFDPPDRLRDALLARLQGGAKA